MFLFNTERFKNRLCFLLCRGYHPTQKDLSGITSEHFQRRRVQNAAAIDDPDKYGQQGYCQEQDQHRYQLRVERNFKTEPGQGPASG